MTAHAGEKAEETTTFRCESCGETVRVHKGEPIPSCSNCGSSAFAEIPDEGDGRELPGRDRTTRPL